MNKIKKMFEMISDEAKVIFDSIQKKGPITRGELSEITGYKLSTLIRIMQPLEDLNLIIQSEIGESSGGRKPVLYDVNSKKYYVIGVDISRTYTQMVVTNLKMEIVEKYRFDMNEDSYPEFIVNRICDWIWNVEKKINEGNCIFLGIGIGTVGPLDRDRGIILNPANFEAKGWENIHLRSILEKKLGLSVLIDNGANAAVYAETYFGIGKGIKNIVYLHCGIGIRTGVISSGSFVRTINETEDAFAHMVIDIDGEQCNCGNFGCIECYSSIHSIIKEFISELKKGKNSVIQKPLNQITYRDICLAAEEKDPIAWNVVHNAAVIMGKGLVNFVNLLNPGLVVLSGPLIKHSKQFYEICVETALNKNCLNKEKSIIFSKSGKFEENAISIGSSALMLENYLGIKQGRI